VGITRQGQGSLGRFNVILVTWDPVQAVVLHSAPTADAATIAFHQARERLGQDRVMGELHVVQHGDETRRVLWEPLA
jgi:hypothetical protein